MKVLHISTFDSGGAGTACVRLHMALLAAGIDSHLLTLHRSRSGIPNHKCYADLAGKPAGNRVTRLVQRKWEQAVAGRRRQQIRHLRYVAGKATDYFSLATAPYRIDLLPGIGEYDIINLHWVADFLDWNSFFSSPLIRKVVWTLHDMHPFTGGYHYANGYTGYLSDEKEPPFLQETFEPGFAAMQLQQKLECLNNTAASIRVVAPSQWLMGCSAGSTLFRRYEHACIPYSLDIHVFKNLNQDWCRTALNIPLGVPVILFVSEYLSNQRKGFHLLTAALEIIAGNNITLCCVGSVVGLNSSNRNVIALGEVRDERVMALAYNAADIFVLPSREDNLPNVVLESLCCGTPVVGFNIGGMPDMIEHGRNGLLAGKVTAEALAGCIRVLLSEGVPSTREAISRDAATRYNPALQASRYLTMYKTM